MNRLKIRFFGFGMLLVSLLFLLTGQVFDKVNLKEAKEILQDHDLIWLTVDQLNEYEDKIAALEKENQQLKGNTTDTTEDTTTESTDETNDTGETTEGQVYQFQITEGMSLADIANGLQGIHIIDDTQSFIDFMTNSGYERYVQIGTYSFKEGMSFEEIADAITR